MEIKPCSCGGTVLMQAIYTNAGMDGSYKDWEFSCCNCHSCRKYPADGFYGRDYYSREEAIAKWNEEHQTYTKDEVVAMLTEIQLDISELKSYESADGQDLVMLSDIGILFQQKINNLKED